MNGDFAPCELEGTGGIVTGSTGIIGKAIGLALADAGVGVVINGPDVRRHCN